MGIESIRAAYATRAAEYTRAIRSIEEAHDLDQQFIG